VKASAGGEVDGGGGYVVGVEFLVLDHIVLTVVDIEATVCFYEKLGMRRESFADGRVALRFGEQKINLHQRGAEISPNAAHATPGSADLCFLVADPVEDVLAALGRAGIAIEEGPVLRAGATAELTSVYIRDPDDNLVELSRPSDDGR
jgi:catechol 2,3-dioxygenase-like lactoylglutathione lyase family enzyme